MTNATLDLGQWEISPGEVCEYLSAVGDESAAYAETRIAPPLIISARVVGLLLERLSLPDGAIHSLQDVETVGAPRIGQTVAASAQVESPRERGGLTFLTVNYSVADAKDSTELQRGRTTVLLPAGTDPWCSADLTGDQ